jgi:hypothetical protein
MHLGVNSFDDWTYSRLFRNGGGDGDYWGGDELFSGGNPGYGGWTPWIQTGINLIGSAIGGGPGPAVSRCGPEPPCDNPPCWDKLKRDAIPIALNKIRTFNVGADVAFWYGDLIAITPDGCFQRVGRASSLDEARRMAPHLPLNVCYTFEANIYCPEGVAPGTPPPGITPPLPTTPPYVPPTYTPPYVPVAPPRPTATAGMDTGTMLAIGGAVAVGLWAMSRRGRS